jgi:hypothetical protein
MLGTGGWIPADEREVLDWMTLVASLGWECMLVAPEEILSNAAPLVSSAWVVLSEDLAGMDDAKRESLLGLLSLYRTVVIGCMSTLLNGRSVSEISSREAFSVKGRQLTYLSRGGSGAWTCRNEVSCVAVPPAFGEEPVLWLETAVIGTCYISGEARFIRLGFRASEARDSEGCFSALLKEMMISECLTPVSWFEWSNTLLLRMDDPGSPQRVNDHELIARTLTDAEWAGIGKILSQRGARLSVGYVPAWVDDGDVSYGELSVKGERVTRVPGTIYPSPYISYRRSGPFHAPLLYDLEEEFRGILKLIREGCVSTELHGYTHMFPDVQAWLQAEDRYSNISWFREFGRKATRFAAQLPEAEHPLEKGIRLFMELFKRMPSTMIFPGEEFTVAAVHAARQKGIKMIGSYYLGMPVEGQLCWNHYICAPYLDRAQASCFDHALPVVGYFHDFDIAQKGLEWLSTHLDTWIDQGASHFIDYAGLCAILSRRFTFSSEADQYRIVWKGHPEMEEAPAVRMGIHIPGSGIRGEVHIPSMKGSYDFTKDDFLMSNK